MYSPKLTPVLNASDDLITNFISGTNVFLNQRMMKETTSYMIADLYHLINDPATRFINIYINSPGGDAFVLTSIINALKIAKSVGIEINTYVTGSAASSASMLALIGDHRFINEYGIHKVHFGTSWVEVTKETEIDKSVKFHKEHLRFVREFYLKYTKLTPKQLDKLMEDEMGILDAKECKKYGLADEII